MIRRLSAGLVVVLVAGALAGCNSGPGSTPIESPTASHTPSPVVSPTRSETAEEKKQREAFEAAEKAYLRGFQEVGRLAMQGGVERPSNAMTETMTGSFLQYQMDLLRELHDGEMRTNSGGDIGWIRLDAYSPESLRLEACEDYRAVDIIESTGSTETPEANTGTRVYRQIVTMQIAQGAWKAWKFETAEQLESCDS